MKNIRKTAIWAVATFVFVSATWASFAAGVSSSEQSAVSLGARLHTESVVFPELPFGDGDISYGVAYEVHSSAAYWQFALDYAPKTTGSNSVDYALTPQLNLLLKDTVWKMNGGVGVLNSYVPSDDETDGEAKDDWSGFYWQFILGLDIPLGSMALKVHAIYPFEDWGRLSEFDVGDIEYGAWLTYVF